MITKDESILLWILAQLTDQNQKAVFVQNYIAEHGPLSEQAGEKVRELLKTHRSLK